MVSNTTNMSMNATSADGRNDEQVSTSEFSLLEYEKRCLDNAHQSPLFANGGMETKFPQFARNGTFPCTLLFVSRSFLLLFQSSDNVLLLQRSDNPSYSH